MMQLSYPKECYLRLGEQPCSGSSLLNWFRVIKQNDFKIDWQFIPKALYVTLMIGMMSPFRWYEKIKLDPQIIKTSVAPPLFIIGHFRSGTTYLHYLLGQDPSLGYVSTFETMTPGMIIAHEKMFRDIVKNHLPAKRPMDDLEMHANLPYEEEYAIANLSVYSFYQGWYFPRKWKYFFDRYVLFKNVSKSVIREWKDVYLYFLKKISYKNDGKRILLKSPLNTARINEILDIFPDAKFIHIYRNPYKVYMSTWKLYKNILPLFSFQHITSEELDDNIIYSYKEIYSKFLKEKNLIPKKNLIEFSYEDFIVEPLKYLKLSYEQLGLEGFSNAELFFEKYCNKHRDYIPSTYRISESIKKKIQEEWSLIFDAYDYQR
jgi:hypothetical protein